MMKKTPPAASPDAYVEAIKGWQRPLVEALRAATHAAGKLDERIKWGHIVYFSNGPVLLIRSEESRLLYGFWRGKRLLGLEQRLKPGGKYELATMTLLEGDSVKPAAIKKLVKAAIELNATVGDPTAILK